jgi:hypothetical protein
MLQVYADTLTSATVSWSLLLTDSRYPSSCCAASSSGCTASTARRSLRARLYSPSATSIGVMLVSSGIVTAAPVSQSSASSCEAPAGILGTQHSRRMLRRICRWLTRAHEGQGTAEPLTCPMFSAATSTKPTGLLPRALKGTGARRKNVKWPHLVASVSKAESTWPCWQSFDSTNATAGTTAGLTGQAVLYMRKLHPPVQIGHDNVPLLLHTPCINS